MTGKRPDWRDEPIYRPRGHDDPERIGGFTILGLLGSGGMGTVHLGLARDGYVAVKQVLPALSGSRRFEREVENLYRLPDGIAPRARANDCTADRPWLATDYVPGCTLTDVVTRCGPLPAAMLWHLLWVLSGHLAGVHAAGIAHRDLTPGNVLLTADGARLIDFGIARAADQVNLTGVGVPGGTRGFIAPEQADGGEVTTKVDVYALGALLCHAATGEWPRGRSDVDSLRAIDPELAGIAEQCLAEDPDARSTAAELVELSRARVSERADPWPTEVMARIAVLRAFAQRPPALPTGRPVHRGRHTVLLAALVALLTGAGAAAAVVYLPRTHH